MLYKQDAPYVMFTIIMAIAYFTPNWQLGLCKHFCSINILKLGLSGKIREEDFSDAKQIQK